MKNKMAFLMSEITLFCNLEFVMSFTMTKLMFVTQYNSLINNHNVKHKLNELELFP
jgi:hypothetical protein